MPRILFVDDDHSIRQTMPAILQMHGYEVVTVATVADALGEIAAHPFDVLIADLNIGQPGDGFTVVSAMRRTQPNCITFILTGYPALETALQAIRSQVDEYLIKPAKVQALIATIEHKLKQPNNVRSVPSTRVSQLLREKTDEIVQRTLRAIKAEPDLALISQSDQERIDHTFVVLQQLAEMLEGSESGEAANRAAGLHGKQRYAQGYSIPLLAVNMRLLEGAIYDVIHENLLSVNLSYLMLDLKQLSASLGKQLEVTLKAYIDAERAA